MTTAMTTATISTTTTTTTTTSSVRERLRGPYNIYNYCTNLGSDDPAVESDVDPFNFFRVGSRVFVQACVSVYIHDKTNLRTALSASIVLFIQKRHNCHKSSQLDLKNPNIIIYPFQTLVPTRTS